MSIFIYFRNNQYFENLEDNLLNNLRACVLKVQNKVLKK
jgi:hypothetical protein